MPGSSTLGPSVRRVTQAAIVGAALALLPPFSAADGQQGPSGSWSDFSNRSGWPNGSPTGRSEIGGYSNDPRTLSRLAEQTAEQTAQSTVESEIKSLLPSSDAKNGKYDWLRRTEFDAGFLQRGKPQQSILTVQPLFQSIDKSDTVFIQGSVFRYAMFGEYRWTGNLGVGYRRLLANNSVLLGLNGFYDREFTNLHQRTSVGGEAKWGPLDWNINRYEPLSGDRAVNGDVEKALGGWDTQLGTQVPFLPWASVYVRYFRWEANVATSDTTGPEYSTEMRLAPGVSLKLSHSSYDFSNYNSRGQNTVVLQLQLAGGANKPTLLTGPVVAKSVFDVRDLSDHTLDKVRRENRIIVERRTTIAGATVIISRLN